MSHHTPFLDERRRVHLPLVLALALLGVLAAYGNHVVQQVRMAPSTVLVAEALSAPVHLGKEQRNPDTVGVASGPPWNELNVEQKHALQPLAKRWALLSELQKRRWLVLAQSFASLPEAEQTKLHNRMTEWASLSAQQRNQARLNFATANKLAPDNKRAQWEAYQALSDEEKRRLAAHAAPRPKGAATALRPVPERKLAQVPAATASNANPINPPKIPRQTGTVQPNLVYPAPALTLQEPRANAPVPALPPVVVETTPVTVPTNPIIQSLPPLAEPISPKAAVDTAAPTMAPSSSGH